MASGFHESRITLVGTGAEQRLIGGCGHWERIIIVVVGELIIIRVGEAGGLGLGGALVLAALVEVPFDHGERARWVLTKAGEGKAREVGNVAVGESRFQRGQHRGEERRVGERDELGRTSSTNGSAGGMIGGR